MTETTRATVRLLAWAVAVTAVVVASLVLTSCSGTTADHAQQVKTCQHYLAKRFAQYMQTGRGHLDHRPPQCDGVTNAELKRIVGKILTGAA